MCEVCLQTVVAPASPKLFMNYVNNGALVYEDLRKEKEYLQSLEIVDSFFDDNDVGYAVDSDGSILKGKYESKPQENITPKSLFEFLEKNIGTASWLRNIHLFTFGTTMSFGPSGASINAMKFAVPKLVNAITKDLFFDDIDTHYKSLKAYDLPEFAMLGDSGEVAPNAPQVRRLEDDSFD